MQELEQQSPIPQPTPPAAVSASSYNSSHQIHHYQQSGVDEYWWQGLKDDFFPAPSSSGELTATTISSSSGENVFTTIDPESDLFPTLPIEMLIKPNNDPCHITTNTVHTSAAVLIESHQQTTSAIHTFSTHINAAATSYSTEPVDANNNSNYHQTSAIDDLMISNDEFNEWLVSSFVRPLNNSLSIGNQQQQPQSPEEADERLVYLDLF